MKVDFGGGEEIAFERIGRAGVVTLTRSKALNALTHGMVKALAAALTDWARDPEVEVVVVKAEGRAFSAGGDILDVYRRGKAGEHPVEFFADEYRLNIQIQTYEKPYISLIDGIVMGGGVGISFHGSHRVISENALFAMPEVGIGFFPDVGGSHFLPKIAGCFGRFLALTGDRVRAGDIMASGMGTNFVASADQPLLLEELAASGNARASLAKFSATPPEREVDDGALHTISRLFSVDTLAEVVDGLEKAAAHDEFAAKTLETMRKRSPTSLHVTFRQLLDGEMLSMAECMRMEYRILNRMLQGHDFYEGIRAALIDKGSTPSWQPGDIAAVSEAEVDAYFAPLGDKELEV
ncbi:enoyl-CoA hydratase/isomerase family protein [Tianweitania sediminis]|jgi:enoyl-CoA hydratase/carnithine racemase|uniref:3-hydroxyisobutyryl-CoA hydrolase n=1 Tax=Tianweitania sediminis TaxID=1502156 RepID=A0A8J7UHD2_9HYPH|nr:enoyl-CoA hydratase/isomerase family protein [Tianweitania sediminis]MBP0439069.1 enoyl-CoA hydratase/isomerase family protein [Tianweitania sediminis]HEV7417008.1 enoyl-CoA hydratase/isomerase family protein [Tianweitania sediminis]